MDGKTTAKMGGEERREMEEDKKRRILSIIGRNWKIERNKLELQLKPLEPEWGGGDKGAPASRVRI